MATSEHEIVKLLYSESSSLSEVALASSILHSRGDWDSQAKHVMQGEDGTCGLREWALLQQVIASSSETVLCKHYKNWTALLTQGLKVNKDEAIHRCLCRGVSSLLERAHQSSKAIPDFAKQKVPLLLQALLSYSTSAWSLQLPALRAVAACLVKFPVGQSQHRAALVSWGKTAVFDPHASLALEGSRLMALLCHHSNQKWVCLFDSAVAALEWTLEQFFSSSKKPSKGKGKSGVTASRLSGDPVLEISPSSLPQSEPQRTAHLFQLVDQLTRTLSVTLLLPPTERAHLPSVPVEKILCAILSGLGRRPPVGHTVECQAMAAGQPILRTSLWNVMCVLLRTCHTHLLQYAQFIRSMLVEEITSRETQQSPLLLASVYRAVSLWVGVAKDYSPAVISPILQSLVAPCDHASSSTRCLRLQVLCEVIESVGPALDASMPSLSAIRQLPFENITSGTPVKEVLMWLRLLGACVCSRGPLSPPYGPVLQLLSDLSRNNPDKQIQTAIAGILSQCNFLMHPSVPPLPNPPPVSTPAPSTATDDMLQSYVPRPSLQEPLPNSSAVPFQAHNEQRNPFAPGTSKLSRPLPASTSSSPARTAGDSSSKRRRANSHGHGAEEDVKRPKRNSDSVCDEIEGVLSDNNDTNTNIDEGNNVEVKVVRDISVDKQDCNNDVPDLALSPQAESESSLIDIGEEKEGSVVPAALSDTKTEVIMVLDEDCDKSSDDESVVSGTELFVDESSDESDSQE